MNKKINEYYKQKFNIEDKVLELANNVEKDIAQQIEKVAITREINQLKVISAMQNNHLSDTHFAGTTGYGYDDRGRDILDAVYAEVLGAEDALVRHNFVSGTHALAVALAGNLNMGDEILSVTGKPYDTLDEIIGIRGDNPNSLKNCGISYKQIDLINKSVDYEKIKKEISLNTKMIFIQRSKGYSDRPTLCVDEIGNVVKFVKEIKPDVLVFVDNCYGEFVEHIEPTDVGADLIAGSLIKNPGGGIAPTGGYIAGNKEYVKRAAERLTAPGIGKKVGASLGFNRLFFQGLFLAPHIVSESIKGAIFAGEMMERLGFKTYPQSNELRSDIIQAIEFGNEKALILFCQGIQKGSPVDSFVRPEPWDMPGYDQKVIMAAGAFIQGSSIELSADAPIKPPYIAYMQGGLVFEHVKIGILTAVSMMIREGIIKIP